VVEGTGASCAQHRNVTSHGVACHVRSVYIVLLERRLRWPRQANPECNDTPSSRAFMAFAIKLNDVPRAVAFYVQHLGFTLTHQQFPAFASVSIGDEPILLSGPCASGSRPMPNGEPQEPGGWNRIVLKVSDPPTFVAELKLAGLRCRNQVGRESDRAVRTGSLTKGIFAMDTAMGARESRQPPMPEAGYQVDSAARPHESGTRCPPGSIRRILAVWIRKRGDHSCQRRAWLQPGAVTQAVTAIVLWRVPDWVATPASACS